jgi:hypothetical protein
LYIMRDNEGVQENERERGKGCSVVHKKSRDGFVVALTLPTPRASYSN